MHALALNLVIATIWLLLSAQPTTPVFVIGFLVGFLLIAAFRTLLPDGESYIRRSLALARFAALFLWQFILSNFSVAMTVLFRSRDRLEPNYITYDTTDLTPGEILLLSYCITLTPGTVSINVSDDGRTLTLHALDAADPAAIRRQIDRGFKRAILAFTR